MCTSNVECRLYLKLSLSHVAEYRVRERRRRLGREDCRFRLRAPDARERRAAPDAVLHAAVRGARGAAARAEQQQQQELFARYPSESLGCECILGDSCGSSRFPVGVAVAVAVARLRPVL